MCGRVYIKSTLAGLMSSFNHVQPGDAEGMANEFPRWNGAPGRDYPVIVFEPDMAGPTFKRATWGFIPRWMREPGGGRRPINAKSEGIATNGIFKNAYRSRRCLMPIDGYFEWRDIHGTGKLKQPYAIAMADGSPFALAAIWETWRDPTSGLDRTTFAVVTCQPNEMMATIHDRMPVILHPVDYERWISNIEPDPADLLKPFPSELMTMWPVSRKVGPVDNDSPDLIDRIELDEPELF